MWNQKKFLKSVFYLLEIKCDNKQIIFNSKIGDRDAITRWKIKKDGSYDRPSLEIITRIIDEFGCSYDWLLTGNEKNNFMRGWTPEEIEYCEKLKKVLKNKGDSDIIKKMINAYIEKYETQTPKKGVLKKKAM